MTALSVEILLTTLMLLADDPRQVRDQVPRGPADVGRIANPSYTESGPAQRAAKDRTGTRPSEEPQRQTDQRPGMESDSGVVNPFAPSSDLSAVRLPPAQPGFVRGAARGAPAGRTLSMPANPFAAVPPGATAGRPAAVYGMHSGPAPATGGAKAFSDYRPPSPVSPYMALYARPTLGIDNYNAYVRPQLEQQAFNQQVQSAFRTLQSERGLPDTTPRSLNQVPQLYPVGPGASGAGFMMLQQYYPGYSGSR